MNIIPETRRAYCQWLLLNAKGAMFQQNHGGEETDANFIILGPPIYHEYEYELRWEVITRLDDIGRIVHKVTITYFGYPV
jgi:hypothetical protein